MNNPDAIAPRFERWYRQFASVATGGLTREVAKLAYIAGYNEADAEHARQTGYREGSVLDPRD